jgi:hypothetical protein
MQTLFGSNPERYHKDNSTIEVNEQQLKQIEEAYKINPAHTTLLAAKGLGSSEPVKEKGFTVEYLDKAGQKQTKTFGVNEKLNKPASTPPLTPPPTPTSGGGTSPTPPTPPPTGGGTPPTPPPPPKPGIYENPAPPPPPTPEEAVDEPIHKEEVRNVIREYNANGGIPSDRIANTLTSKGVPADKASKAASMMHDRYVHEQVGDLSAGKYFGPKFPPSASIAIGREIGKAIAPVMKANLASGVKMSDEAMKKAIAGETQKALGNIKVKQPDIFVDMDKKPLYDSDDKFNQASEQISKQIAEDLAKKK